MAIVSTTVIRDVNNSIRELLIKNINSQILTDVSFQSPGEPDVNVSSNKKLSQFLLQIKNNGVMRNQGRSFTKTSSATPLNIEVAESPIYVDLIYMLTSLEKDITKNLEMLEQVMRVLYDLPVLKSSTNEKVRITPIEFNTESLNNIWSMFPNQVYRPSLFYTVGPVKIISSNIYIEQKVKERIQKVNSGTVEIIKATNADIANKK